MRMSFPDCKVHGANMGPIWGQQDPGEPHVGPMNLAIWEAINSGWLLTIIGAAVFTIIYITPQQVCAQFMTCPVCFYCFSEAI